MNNTPTVVKVLPESHLKLTAWTGEATFMLNAKPPEPFSTKQEFVLDPSDSLIVESKDPMELHLEHSTVEVEGEMVVRIAPDGSITVLGSGSILRLEGRLKEFTRLEHATATV
jgi:hypothetical protein